VVLAALLAAGSGSAGANDAGSYEDPHIHFRISFPARFTAAPVTDTGGVFRTGVVVANTSVDLTRTREKPWKRPPNAVAFALTHVEGDVFPELLLPRWSPACH
jgi:hypothetical protein